MEIKINLEIGVTPALNNLLRGLLSEMASSHSAAPSVVLSSEEMPEPVIEPQPVAEQQPEVKDEPKKEADQPKEITNVQLRDAMDEVRKKFEFTDPDNPEVANPQIHKNLTKQFKEIAHELDAEKPTTLPQEKRETFLEHLTWIKVDEKGEVTCLPF